MGNIVVFGGSGGLGKQLCNNLIKSETFSCRPIIPLSSSDVDITNFNQVRDFFNDTKVSVVINLSGYNYNMILHKYNWDEVIEVKKQIEVNIEGNLNILANCLPIMREDRYGRIIELEHTIRYLINTEYVSGCSLKVNGGLDF